MSLQRKIRNLGLKITGAPVIHCLGDSHLAVFEYINKERLLKKTAFEFCIVHGATAMGIPNPASKTQAGPIFENYLKKVPKKNYILTCLGEVDCGFVIWYRSKKYKDPVEKQFELAVANYTNFLKDMLHEGRKLIIVCSAPLPTIKDGQKWGEIATLRNEVDSTLRQRTDMTIALNKRMREYCEKNGLIFLDLETRTLNKKTQMIDDKFLNPNKLDHHLDPREFSKVVVEEMNRNGFK